MEQDVQETPYFLPGPVVESELTPAGPLNVNQRMTIYTSTAAIRKEKRQEYKFHKL